MSANKDWKERIQDEQKQEKQREEILKNAQMTSNPEFHASLVILASLCSNSNPTVCKMNNDALIYKARQVAKDLIKEFE